MVHIKISLFECPSEKSSRHDELIFVDYMYQTKENSLMQGKKILVSRDVNLTNLFQQTR